MILNHVANRAGGVVIGAAAAGHADLLGHRDLHRVDMPAVPERLEDAVAEPQGQDVLDCFLAEIVIDAVDLALVEDGRDFPVQGTGARKIAAERLFDDHPAPGRLLLRRVDQPRLAQAVDDRSEKLG